MLQVSIPIAHELLGQCVKQGQALVQRASLVGDFSDYESWKAARRQWIEPTVQALEHVYGGPSEAREFVDAVTCAEGAKRWQEQYSTDLKCVEDAIELLTTLRGELAFVEDGTSGTNGPFGTVAASGPAELGQGVATEGTPIVEQQPERVDLERELLDEADRRADGSPQQPIAPERPAERTIPEQPAPSERPAGSELTQTQRMGAELTHHTVSSTPAERDPAGAPAPERSKQVLLAHGRDERWRQAVEHLLEQSGGHQIRIVNRRADERARLVDVLGEESSSSRYAVVLLTADDVGGPRLESDAEPYFSTRAHQEVVFEMGFLVAALSPGRVCVLYEDGVELPYDLEGVSHVRLDLAGTWQPKLLLHLRRAGFDYDMNRLASV
jgi:predicted nucleotide-binding protein